ncbi:MAG: dephospho-CoA kinase [Bacteroidales bacterium]|nr:dephospho-CoA kinase [Bacteroidales bacterium]
MIKAGVTGGIGSGKTMVCQVFRLLGVPVYCADDEAKKLYDTSVAVRNRMIGLLGEDIYSGLHLDRGKLAGLIFNNRELLEQVNAIVHPEVTTHFLEWCQRQVQEHYIIQESAILFESGIYRIMDVKITVTAPDSLKIKRIMTRPGMTETLAARVIENQIPDDIKAGRSDFVITNDDRHLVIPQILKIHESLMKMENPGN